MMSSVERVTNAIQHVMEKERDRLTGVPRLALALGDLGHVDQERDVARQQLLADSPVEGVADFRGTGATGARGPRGFH